MFLIAILLFGLALMVQDFEEIRALMKGEGLSDAAIGAFQQAYEQLVRGDDGMISEASISPATDVPVMADIKGSAVSDDKATEASIPFRHCEEKAPPLRRAREDCL
jgi:thiazole synthase ThiGH ThiG subunit